MQKVERNAMTLYRYDRAAERYSSELTIEDLMEAPTQGTQRKITLESLDLVNAARPEVHVFNELLVQYPLQKDKIGQVVPDNLVVVHDGPLTLTGSFDVPFQPVGPFWVLEYVSKKNKRKDFETNMEKYAYLRIPYYLLFYPDDEELSLFKFVKSTRTFRSVKPNENDRLAIRELEIEIGLHAGWARYWFRGELLPLPADLQRDLAETRKQLATATRRADDAARRADDAARRADDLQRQIDNERLARQSLEQELARLQSERKSE